MHDAAPYRHSAELGLIDFGYPAEAGEALLRHIASAASPAREVQDWAHDRLLDLLKQHRDGGEPADALPYVQAISTLMDYAMACERDARLHDLDDVVAKAALRATAPVAVRPSVAPWAMCTSSPRMRGARRPWNS